MVKKFLRIIRKTLLWILGLLLVLVLSAYLLLKYRIKDIVEEVVKVQTDNAYEIKFDDFDFALLDGDIKIKNAQLDCIHPVAGEDKYFAKIPGLYFSLESWKQLIFNKQMIIDSMDLVSPELSMYKGATKNGAGEGGFQLGDTYNLIKNLSHKLGVRKLNIENAGLAIHFADSSLKPFNASKINFRVSNFLENADSTKRLLSTDDIDLLIKDQAWVFPRGATFSFRSLHFSGNSQLFQIDSCQFSAAPAENKSSISLAADQIKFTSHQLTEIYGENRLALDTVYLAQPILYVTTAEKQQQHDSSAVLTSAVNRLFEDINVKYISIEKGQITLQSANQHSPLYKTEKTDLVIKDLDINQDTLPHLSIGDIALHLKEINLATKDSLYVLSIRDFGLSGNSLICRNATFAPTRKNKVNSGLKVEMPLLVLNELSLPDLLEKKLKASSAVISSPHVTLNSTAGENSAEAKTGEGLSGLYHTLNGLAQLINVQQLTIQNAYADINSRAANGTSVIAVKNINASINLYDFLVSYSLLNIKQAIPSLTIDKINFAGPKLRASVDKLAMEGTIQRNNIASLSLATKTGTVIKAVQLYWQKFDWDNLITAKHVNIDSLSFKTLSIDINQDGAKGDETAKKTGGLPSFFIRKMNAQQVSFALKGLNGKNISAKSSNIAFDGLSNTNNKLNWNSFAAKLKDVNYRNAETTVTVAAVDLSNEKESSLKNISYTSNNALVNVAAIKFRSHLHSVAEDNLDIDYVAIEDPNIELKATSKANAARQAATSTAKKTLNIGSFKMNNGLVDFKKQADSLFVSGAFKFDINKLSVGTGNAEKIRFASFGFDLANINLSNKKFNVLIPQIAVNMSDGSVAKTTANETRIKTSLNVDWKNISAEKISKLTSNLLITQLSGNISKNEIDFTTGEKVDKASLLLHTNITDAKIHFGTNAVLIDADSLQWIGDKGNFIVNNIKVLPTITRDTFFTVSQWQKDYLTLQVQQLFLHNIDTKKLINDSSLYIREIAVSNPEISTSRNKNIPLQHGIEKLMPTKLIAKIKMPLKIDSVIVNDATVNANEISNITQREGTIPLIHVNAQIKNISNTPGANDSLSIRAQGVLLDHYIRSLKYKESYSDSLSGFRMSVRMSPMDLTALSNITNPLAAVNIDKGHSDTLYARIAGNKYAAFGVMNFYYKGLKIRMLNHTDTLRKSFILSLESFLANKLIVKTNNKKNAQIFFVRDPEKFVFNYWIKSAFSGVITSAGVKSNKKYEKKYKAVKKAYSLPDKTD